MKTRRTVGMALALTLTLGLASALFGTSADAKEKVATTRTVMGRVLNQNETPLPDAVVYLTNTKSADIRTFIADKDGAFHFSALAQNVDYEISAKYQDHKSEVKKLSQFDSRTQAVINLRVDVP